MILVLQEKKSLILWQVFWIIKFPKKNNFLLKLGRDSWLVAEPV